MNSKRVEEFAKVLEDWKDTRFMAKDEVLSAYKFLVLQVNLAEQDDWQYDGHSLKISLPMSVLTVKATIEGVPYVVFSSGRTTMECIRSFLRKQEGGFLDWRKDRFRS